MKIKMRYEWFDEAEKTALRYIMEDDWNWKDYHAGVRASLFSIMNHPTPIDSIIDLRQHTRPKMPAGMPAHMSSFGKKLTKSLSGNAIVIGLSDADKESLPLNPDGTMDTTDGMLYFAADDEEARDILTHIRAEYA